MPCNCKKGIVPGEDAMFVCIRGDHAYPLFPFLIEEYENVVKVLMNSFLLFNYH